MKKRLVALVVGFMLVLSTLALAACSDENPDPSPSGGESATYDVSGKIELRLDEMDTYKKIMGYDGLPKFAEYMQIESKLRTSIMTKFPSGIIDVYVDGAYATTAKADLTYALKDVKKDAKITAKLSESASSELKNYVSCLTFPEYTVTKTDTAADLEIGLNVPQYYMMQFNGGEGNHVTSDTPMYVAFYFSAEEIENGIPDLVLVNGKKLLPFTTEDNYNYISQNQFTDTKNAEITLGAGNYMLVGNPSFSNRLKYFACSVTITAKSYTYTVLQDSVPVVGVEVTAYFAKRIDFSAMAVEFISAKATTDTNGKANVAVPSEAIMLEEDGIAPMFVGAKKEGMAFRFSGLMEIYAFAGTSKSLTIQNTDGSGVKDIMVIVNGLLTEAQTDANGLLTFSGITGQGDGLNFATQSNLGMRPTFYEKNGDAFTKFSGVYPSDQTELTLYKRTVQKIAVYGAKELLNYSGPKYIIVGTKTGAPEIRLEGFWVNASAEFAPEDGYTYQIKPEDGSSLQFDTITIGAENEYQIQNVKLAVRISITNISGFPVDAATYTVKAMDGTELASSASENAQGYVYIDAKYLKELVKIEVTAEGYTVQPQYYVLLELSRTNTIRLERTI